MNDEPDLPLHAEAKARAGWRGGETILAKGAAQGLPASEVDDAALTDGEDSAEGRSPPAAAVPPPD